MVQIYLFDVDGTLTPPRRPMTREFALFFVRFVSKFNVYLVSGSTYEMIREQVSEPILELCCGIFGSSGCEFYSNGNMVFQKEHTFDPHLLQVCEQFVEESRYPHMFGNHVEFRAGTINVSAVGRNATPSERDAYFNWDKAKGERMDFAARVNNEFPQYEASVGGEISVDIVPAGWNKSTVKGEILSLHPDARLCFFGDRMGSDGNDYPLAEALKEPGGMHRSVPVKSYHETENELRTILGD